MVLNPEVSSQSSEKALEVLQSRRKFRMWVTFPFLIFLIFLLAGFTFNYIPSESMLPNLKPGDNIVTMRSWIAYPFGRSPARGDVVVFKLPAAQVELAAEMRSNEWINESGDKMAKPEILIKRIVGLPGETVQMQGGEVYINGQKLAEDYSVESLEPGSYDPYPFADTEPLTIPSGHYFLLGDNRKNSEDSRIWGALKRSTILGKFVRVLYHDEKQRQLFRRGGGETENP